MTYLVIKRGHYWKKRLFDPSVTCAATEHHGCLFWITCKRLKLLRKASCLQVIQNSAPSVVRWCQCDIRKILTNGQNVCYFGVFFLVEKFEFEGKSCIRYKFLAYITVREQVQLKFWHSTKNSSNYRTGDSEHFCNSLKYFCLWTEYKSANCSRELWWKMSKLKLENRSRSVAFVHHGISV